MHLDLVLAPAFAVIVGAVIGAWMALATPLGMERFGATFAEHLHGERLGWLLLGLMGCAIPVAGLAIAVAVLAIKLRRSRAAQAPASA